MINRARALNPSGTSPTISVEADDRYGKLSVVKNAPLVPHLVFLIWNVVYLENGLGIFCTGRRESMLVPTKPFII